jgi:hypothetical protein
MEKNVNRPLNTKVEIWKCEDMKKLVHEAIEAHVKDASGAKRLEQALMGNWAYAPTSRIMILEDPDTTKEK